jgi:hypothetical protein
MTDRKQEIERFFDQYAGRFNNVLHGAAPDIDAIVGSFADCFIEASPLGVSCGKNNEQFREVIPKGYEYYKAIGITSMDILHKDISLLDDFHSMARISWRSSFRRKDGVQGSIDFVVIYLLQSLDTQHRIFCYVTGDEQKALKENDLI